LVTSAYPDQARVSAPDQVLARQAAGETVLLDLDSEQYFSLDGIGNRLWQLIEEGTLVGAAVARLAGEYDVDVDVLRSDVEELLTDLHAAGLVLIDGS
jgi:hypothetical protein